MDIKADANKWVSVSEVIKRSAKAGLFVNTPKTKTEFYKDSGRDYVNITNWDNDNECHVYYQLACFIESKIYFAEKRHSRDGSLLQSNTFNTIKELKDYLKTV